MLRNVSSMDVTVETQEISEAYLAVINALSCVSERHAWIFVSKVEDNTYDSPSAKRVKRDDNSFAPMTALTTGQRTRTALSLGDIRKEYTVELERQKIILGKTDDLGLDARDF
jgi:hypothetical protein